MKFFVRSFVFMKKKLESLWKWELWKWLLVCSQVEISIGLCFLLSVKQQKWNFCFQGYVWLLSIHWCSTLASNLAVNNIHMGLCCACAFLTSWPLTSWGKGDWCGFVLLLLENTTTNGNRKSRIRRVHSLADWMMRSWVCSSSPMTALYPGSYWRT